MDALAPAVPHIINLQPGDIIIVNSPRPLSQEQGRRIMDQVRELAPGHRVALLMEGITIDIMRPTAGRPMERGDLFAGIGGWMEDGEDLDRIVWLTADQAAAYRAHRGYGVYLLDEAI